MSMDLLSVTGLGALLTLLKTRGYRLVGPTVRSGAIIIDAIDGVDDLPRGVGDDQDPGHYGLTRRDDGAFFGFSAGPASWKRYFVPPRMAIWRATRNGKTFAIADDDGGQHPPLALIGVRPCDLRAMELHDKVFLREGSADPLYARVRASAFVLLVQCTSAGGTCFCDSMGTGPFAEDGFDIALTELIREGRHVFLARAGSQRGKEVLEAVPREEALPDDLEDEQAHRENIGASFTRRLTTEGVREALRANLDHPHWDEIAKRCMACTSCTMVCPTCFCFTVEDVTDLTGMEAERLRRWDSCFSMEFTKVAGGNIRPATRSRYRQWLTHKLSYWVDQFGTMGCVGCGRCITWCPAGIDLTVEASRFPLEQTPA
jgi:sulfhydrogenase subunit beta (sulfur reductase)